MKSYKEIGLLLSDFIEELKNNPNCYKGGQDIRRKYWEWYEGELQSMNIDASCPFEAELSMLKDNPITKENVNNGQLQLIISNLINS